MLKYIYAALFVGLLSMTGCSADNGPEVSKKTRLPSTFSPSDVRIVAIRQSNITSIPMQRVILQTTGGASLEQNGEVQPFECPVAEIVAAFSDIYRINFFDLPSNLTISRSATLGDDGLIRLSLLRMSDMATTSIEVSVEGYSHKVVFAENGPPELVAVAEQLFAVGQKFSR